MSLAKTSILFTFQFSPTLVVIAENGNVILESQDWAASLGYNFDGHFQGSSFNFQAPFVPQLVMAYSSFLGGELLLYQLCLLSLLDPFPHLLASAEHSNPLNPSSA